MNTDQLILAFKTRKMDGIKAYLRLIYYYGSLIKYVHRTILSSVASLSRAQERCQDPGEYISIHRVLDIKSYHLSISIEALHTLNDSGTFASPSQGFRQVVSPTLEGIRRIFNPSSVPKFS